ncbi:SMI1/KNR4 family protein [Haloferula sp.]|uniref:SMI1/KNR4 family protein n=1 Tax=Haloferula sp. TaxID=2497595 RepID=UPI00329BB786
MNFDERIQVIWDEPNERLTEAPADAALIAEVEAALGVKLPADYLHLIKKQNGGYFCWFNHCEGADWDASELRGLRRVGNKNWEELKEYMAEEQIDTPREIDGLIPFAGDVHVSICFDYRGVADGAEPSIAFIDVESFDIDRTIAPNFRAYIEKLGHRSPYIEYAIETPEDGSEVMVEALESVFSVAFDDWSEDYDSDTYKACYPSFSAKEKGLPFSLIWLRRCKSKSGLHSCFQVPQATWFLNIGDGVPEKLIRKFVKAPGFDATLLYEPRHQE